MKVLGEIVVMALPERASHDLAAGAFAASQAQLPRANVAETKR
jgi:hypothetical protein